MRRTKVLQPSGGEDPTIVSLMRCRCFGADHLHDPSLYVGEERVEPQPHDVVHAEAEDAALAAQVERSQHERAGAPLDLARAVHAVVRREGHGNVGKRVDAGRPRQIQGPFRPTPSRRASASDDRLCIGGPVRDQCEREGKLVVLKESSNEGVVSAAQKGLCAGDPVHVEDNELRAVRGEPPEQPLNHAAGRDGRVDRRLKHECGREVAEALGGSESLDSLPQLRCESVDLFARVDRKRVVLVGVVLREDRRPGELLEAGEGGETPLDTRQAGDRRDRQRGRQQ